jgi:predicted dehydrogenase
MQEQESLEVQLANMGLPRNSEAWNRAKSQLSGQWAAQDKNVLAQSLAEGRADAQSQYGMNQQSANQQQAFRQQGIAEEAQRRGMTLNELNALLTGQQVSMPQMPNFQQAQAAQAPNLLGAATQAGNYGINAAQLGQSGGNDWGSAIGGIASAAGAIAPFVMSDVRLKSNIRRIGTHYLGVGIYAYEIFGKPEVGVLAQELQQIRPDLVHVTTPPASHFSIVKDCVSAGCNVLCEKPITVGYQELRELQQLAAQNDCLLLENHNLKFHSSILKIGDLIASGRLGDVLDVQVYFCLNITGPGSPYVDRNAPHFGSVLRAGVIGDFLPHIAYLALMFTGAVVDLRTVWTKCVKDSPLPADEFRAFIKGERATAYVGFSGNGKPNGFWVRLTGTLMQVETNLLEPPRLIVRRARAGEQAIATLVDGVAEARSLLSSVVAGFWRKLGGRSRYDGLAELIARTYQALASGASPPVSPGEIDEVARLVDAFSSPALKL